jgi:putative tryptophan/tyrosine transport system substrate-binding protein
LFNPATAPFAEYYLNHFKASAASFAVEAIAAPVRDTSELESVVAVQAREPNSGLIVMPEAFMNVHRAEVTSLAAHYHLPAVYPRRFFAEFATDGKHLRDVSVQSVPALWVLFLSP